MSTLVKTYRVASGELKFEFVYNPSLGSLTDFSIVDVSPLRYGYDSDDPKSISIYPANIDIVIDDLAGDNHTNFRQFYSIYKAVFPFNHYIVLHLIISLNGAVIFKGLIDEVSNEYDSKSVKVSFVDGLNWSKSVNIGNPYYLDHLSTYNVIPRVQNGNAIAYGFTGVYYTGGKGYSVRDTIAGGDKDVNLELVIRMLIQSLRSDLNIEFQNDYKFGDEGVSINDMVGIQQVNLRRVMSNLFGRYVVIYKQPGLHNNMHYREGQDPEYCKLEYWDLVFEDELYVCYYHNWDGTYPAIISGQKYQKGVDSKTVAEILKLIAINLFSYFGLKGANTFFFRHKRYSSSATPLSGIRSMSKSLAIDKVNEVVIKDYYSDNYARKGNNYNIDDQSIEYKIPLNAFRTLFGWEYRLNYFAAGQVKSVIHFYDPYLQIRDIPQELLSSAEWQSHKDHLNQYEFELAGIDYHMDKTYSVNQDNYTGLVRPITIEKDLLNEVTQMTALEI